MGVRRRVEESTEEKENLTLGCERGGGKRVRRRQTVTPWGFPRWLLLPVATSDVTLYDSSRFGTVWQVGNLPHVRAAILASALLAGGCFFT